jgi:hypothetical protein
MKGNEKSMVKTIFILIIFDLTILISCSSPTQLTNMYVNSEYETEGFKKVLILGMATKTWEKKVYENEYITQFKKHNIEAIPAWRVLPEGEELTKETFQIYFKDENIDAVLVARATGMSTKETMYGGGTSYVAAGFYGFYISTSPIYRVPGYLAEEKIIYMETTVYETSEGKLVWSATSKSYEPKSTGEVIKTVSRNVVDELYLAGFVK